MSLHSSDDVAFLLTEAERHCDAIIDLLAHSRALRELLSTALVELRQRDLQIDRLRDELRAARERARRPDAAA